MNIVVVIPNDDWQSTAGVRIRYKRLAPALAALGHTLSLQALDHFSVETMTPDHLCVFSKSHDVRTVLLARAVHARGGRVGVDFFDDYYSQTADSRFVHLRRWFRAMAPLLDFALCSTPNMAARLQHILPKVACHIINDPADTYDPVRTGEIAAQNAQLARASRDLPIGWFGIGDNPHFSLGISDLHAFSGLLVQARRLGYAPRLEILTNPRAFTLERMEMLARLPVPYSLHEWTLEREQDLVRRSLVCFVPVNAQDFSVVKSLNRGVTTLTGGAQLLSAGFPLYDALDGFVYRDLKSLIHDLEAGQLKLRSETVSTLSTLMARLGTPEVEAVNVVAFLSGIAPRPVHKDGLQTAHPVAVVHGIVPAGNIHKAVQRMGALSVAAPQTARTLNFDLAIDPERLSERQCDVILSKAAANCLKTGFADRLQAIKAADGRPVFRLTVNLQDDPGRKTFSPEHPARRIVDIARYSAGLLLISNLLDQLFDTPELFLAENRPPFFAVSEATFRSTTASTGS